MSNSFKHFWAYFLFTFNFISLIFQDWFQVSSTLFAIRAAEQWRDNSNWWKQLHGHDSLFTWFIHKIVAEKRVDTKFREWTQYLIWLQSSRKWSDINISTCFFPIHVFSFIIVTIFVLLTCHLFYYRTLSLQQLIR